MGPLDPLDGGTTSACAENTRTLPVKWCGWRNYLRVRGEYPRPQQFPNDSRELPPRARRILRLAPLIRLSYGTTSACAENTMNDFGRNLAQRNYLRVRGEY